MFSHHSPSNTQEDLFDRAGHHSLVFRYPQRCMLNIPTLCYSLTSSPRTATINDGNTNANKYTNTDKNNSKLGSLNGWYKNNNLQQPINSVAARSVFQSTQQPPAAINNDPGFQQQIVLGNAAQIAVDSTQQQQLQDRQPVSCQMMLTTLSHYELHTPSDLLMSSSVADCGGFTSPIPRSPLRPIVSALCNGTFDESANKSKKHSLAGSIKTPIARISAVKEARVCKTTTSISDTPYHSRKRNNLPDRAALPILADHILDMRLCSSPCYAQATNTTNPNTANVMQNDYNNDCQSSGEIHRLPHHFSPKDTIRRISPQTMVDLLDGQYAHCYDRLLVIDCRYPYEYLGGHIPGAVNVNRPDAIDQLLLENPPDSRSLHTCIVFHCEFSSQRAPRMALHVRNFDRLLNSERYPHLHYPEIYILDGGYKAFFDAHSVCQISF